MLRVFLLVCLASSALAACPFAHLGTGPETIAAPARRVLLAYDAKAVSNLDWKAVKADIKDVLTTSKDSWPADFGHYGGLMIRLAWHCAGSYRSFDGRGGCDGARIRFYPEGSWPDNTNLDKARKLLAPIKDKYGDALSWGDLIVLTGNTAIESMGGPVLGFCAGRIDDVDGNASLPLGPTPEQQVIAPCIPGQGNCSAPLGASTMGLIYVNPEGPMGQPDPVASAPQIREVFGRMGMNDSETVALIGGGHAFGKTHGACSTGPGPSPLEDPENPWPGTCGEGPNKGKGLNTFTSGFEGAWTTTPTNWSNSYFKNLLNFEWEVHIGPGNHSQWRPKAKVTRAVDARETPDIMMLTTDIALTKDPQYLKLVKLFADNQTALEEAFKHAWYKLTTRDMGPVERCLGPDVPPAQPFQYPLPAPTAVKLNYTDLAGDIRAAIATNSSILKADKNSTGQPYYGALLAALAYRCAATYRDTDKTGGCNGAKIRFAPQKDWPVNSGLDKALAVLAPIKKEHPNLSFADLIVLAGTTALRDASGKPDLFPFCLGRSDALDANGTEELAPRVYLNATRTEALRDTWAVQGLTPREGVALAALPRSPSQQQRLNYSGSWTQDPSKLSNAYYKLLLNTDWQESKSAAGQVEYGAAGQPGVYMTPDDLVIKNDTELAAIAKEYAGDNDAFLQALSKAWFKLMNADRFKGPAGNLCEEKDLAADNATAVQPISAPAPSPAVKSAGGAAVVSALTSVAALLLSLALAALVL